MKRWPLVASFVLFILLCASVAYWGLQMFKPPLRPVAAPPRASADIRPEAAAVLFGGRAGNVAVASNYQLKGVVMSGSPRESVAIMSADGKPAQAVGVGKEVLPGVTVKEVHRDYVLLSEDGAIKRVELPESFKEQVNVATTAPVPVAPPPTSPVQQAPLPQSAPAAAPSPAPAAPVAPAVPTTPAPQAPAAVPTAPGTVSTAPPTTVVVRPPQSAPSAPPPARPSR